MTRLSIAWALALLPACNGEPTPKSAPLIALPAPDNYYESDIVSPSARTISRLRLQQICLGDDDAQHVERYDGEFGPSKSFVLAKAPATARLSWNSARVNKYVPQQGTLHGAACTGTLVAPDLLLTAAHCIEIGPNARTSRHTPLRMAPGSGYEPVPPEEIALLLDAEFNYQLAPDGSRRASVSFAVEKVVEYGIDSDGSLGVDFALLKLAPLADDRKAGDLFQWADWNADDEAYDGASLLTVIQHPDGDFKKIHAGRKKDFAEESLRQELRYGSIDTLASSSGSGIIDQAGRLIGIHVRGGCEEVVKYNAGVSLVAVRARSEFFQGSDGGVPDASSLQ